MKGPKYGSSGYFRLALCTVVKRTAHDDIIIFKNEKQQCMWVGYTVSGSEHVAKGIGGGFPLCT